MPTGFTVKLIEEGQSFNDFVLTCARAFGPLIELRDLPLNALIPENFTGMYSFYHKDGLDEAQNELKRLQRMSDKKREAYGKTQKRRDITAFKKSLEKVTAQYQRVVDMEKRVSNWKPPVAYAGLKTFMLSQLNMVKDSPETFVRLLKETANREPIDFWNAAVERAMRDITYHKRELVDSIKLTKNNMKWVRGLQRALRIDGTPKGRVSYQRK